MKKFILHTITAFLAVGILGSCDSGKQQKSITKIVTTTGMIGDAVKNIVGDSAEVVSLMGPGVDPHLYKAAQGDLVHLREADIIIYNGLHLEGKMGRILEKLGKVKPVVPAGEAIPKDRLMGHAKAPDPHIWFDLSIWAIAIEHIGNELIRHDSAHHKYYKKNMQRYLGDIKALHKEVKKQVKTIPEKQRVLITAHDAFSYFGRAYDIEVKGLQGISTLSDFGLRDITNLVDFIRERNVKALFVESSVPQKAIEAVVEGCRGRGHQVKIGGTLYSDAMGEPGTPQGTYLGMVKHNVTTITEALK